jgi:hypothetical protein
MLALTCSLLGSCQSKTPHPEPTAKTSSAVETSSATPEVRSTTPSAACQQHWNRYLAEPALPGAPLYEKQRAEILGRAKGEPIVFLRTPQPTPDLPLRLQLIRDKLKRGSPYMSVPTIINTLRFVPEDLRKVLLREGYVYSEDPVEATALTFSLKLTHLFREPIIYLARDSSIFKLKRDEKFGVYRYAEGAKQGQEVPLLFADRVATERGQLLPLLHRSIKQVALSQGSNQIQIQKLTANGMLAGFRYGQEWVPTVLKDSGKEFTFVCDLATQHQQPWVAEQQEQHRWRTKAIHKVLTAGHDMVKEHLRFDEPLKEEGQQDGSLRPLWRWAYDHGSFGYSFNGVGYAVFDQQGRPYPPQVCIDFVLDAYERASGTWFLPQKDVRKRTSGAIDFEKLTLENRRSAAEFVNFSEANPTMFHTWNLAPFERIPFAQRTEFFAFLRENRDQFHAGDAIIIHGFKPDGQVHYHSFLIDQVDPISGMPTLLIGNAGRPRSQSWEGVMRSAPMRSIKHVISPQLSWLRKALMTDQDSIALR